MILNSGENKLRTGMILIHLQKAFDTLGPLDHNILKDKMKCKCFSDKTIGCHSLMASAKNVEISEPPPPYPQPFKISLILPGTSLTGIRYPPPPPRK